MTQASSAAATPDRARPRALRVGEWHVAGELNRITRGAETVVLEPKTMALLLQLAARAGEVVSRDELLAAVWPGVVVGDNALTQAVAKLRKALGDTAREPAYVEAIAKRGYRLIAAVGRADDVPPTQVDEAASSPAPIAAPASSGVGAVDDAGGATPAYPAAAAAGPAAHDLAATAPGSPPLVADRDRDQRRRVAAFAAVGVLATLVALGWPVLSGRVDATPAPHVADAPAHAAALPVVVVRPFGQLGGEASQADVARAITADLVTDLSKVAGIRVVAAAGSDADKLPSEPGPRYVLEGTVQHAGERLRLNVLLSDARDGRTVWSTRLDRAARDLFDVQDDVVRQILQTLPIKVSEAESRRLAQRHTRNVDAWEAFVRAQTALLVRQRASNETARGLYWEAIRRDPAFARAYSGLALTYALEAQLGWAREPDAALARAVELADTSIGMNPNLPEARWVLGFVHAQRREHEQALRDLDAALRLNPSYADAYALKGGILTYLGRPAEAVPLLRQALRLNPEAGSLYFLLLGRAYYFLDDREQAQVNLHEALARNAQGLEARLYLAATCAARGDEPCARWQADEIRVLEPGFRASNWLRTYPLSAAAARERLHAALRSIGLD